MQKPTKTSLPATLGWRLRLCRLHWRLHVNLVRRRLTGTCFQILRLNLAGKNEIIQVCTASLQLSHLSLVICSACLLRRLSTPQDYQSPWKKRIPRPRLRVVGGIHRCWSATARNKEQCCWSATVAGQQRIIHCLLIGNIRCCGCWTRTFIFVSGQKLGCWLATFILAVAGQKLHCSPLPTKLYKIVSTQ